MLCAAQVIHGGRPEVGYYGDVWAFDLNTLEWEVLRPLPGLYAMYVATQRL